jgi:hypothetical protein
VEWVLVGAADAIFTVDRIVEENTVTPCLVCWKLVVTGGAKVEAFSLGCNDEVPQAVGSVLMAGFVVIGTAVEIDRSVEVILTVGWVDEATTKVEIRPFFVVCWVLVDARRDVKEVRVVSWVSETRETSVGAFAVAGALVSNLLATGSATAEDSAPLPMYDVVITVFLVVDKHADEFPVTLA